jgi:hypothetical protein
VKKRKMTDDEKSHWTFASIGNLVAVGLLIKSAWDGNDKAIIFVIIFYPLLILMNGLIWMNLSSKKRSESKIYRATTLGLIILFLPVLIIASLH